jgi:hypothetical protein
MEISELFLWFGFVNLIWGVISLMVITAFVTARGTRINYSLYRLYISNTENKNSVTLYLRG